jgi:hypothetical protein
MKIMYGSVNRLVLHPWLVNDIVNRYSLMNKGYGFALKKLRLFICPKNYYHCPLLILLLHQPPESNPAKIDPLSEERPAILCCFGSVIA